MSISVTGVPIDDATVERELARHSRAPDPRKAAVEALVETRFGIHVVRVERRAEGRTYPLEMVREQLAAHLLEQKRKRALRQYLQALLTEAGIQGAESSQECARQTP